MHALLRQTTANLKSHKLPSALILVTFLATATLLTLALITFRTAGGAYERLFERTHGAHLWFYLDPRRVTVEEATQALTDLAGLEGTTGVMHALSASLFVGEEAMRGQELREWPGEVTAIARPLLIAGRAPEPGETNAVVLDRNVAAAYELKVGETIDLMTPNGRYPLTIVGFQVNAIHCPFPNCQPAREYVAPGTLTSLRALLSPSSGVEYVVAGLRLRDPTGKEEVVRAVGEALPPSAIVAWWDWKEVGRHCEESALLQKILFTAFSIVAGLAAGLLMANIIVEAVRAQARQIGLLKAVGFTGRQLACVYLVEYLALALIASLGGLVLGNLLASTILRSIAVRFGETLVYPPLWVALVTPLIILLVAALFTFAPVRRAVRQDVIQAIRVGVERPRRRAVRLLRLPFSLAMGVGDVFSQPVRSVLTALGLGVAVVALTSGLTTVHTIRAYTTDPGLAGMRDGHLLVFPRGIGDAEVRRLIEERSEVMGYYGELEARFQFPEEDDILQAHFVQGDLQAFRFSLLEGRMLEAPDEAVVSYVLARERNLHPGDSLTILLAGEPVTLRVVGIYRESVNLGRMLRLPLEVLHRVRPAAEPSRYILKVNSGIDVQALAAALESDNLLKVSEIELPRTLVMLPGTLGALSLVLGGIAAVGVFNTAWMGVQERRREFGLLKATGMTPTQVTLSVLAGMAAMALGGYAVGVAVGLPGIHLLFDVLGRGMGFGPLDALVDVPGQVLLLPGIALLAVLAAFFPAHLAGRTSVVEVLRHE